MARNLAEQLGQHLAKNLAENGAGPAQRLENEAVMKALPTEARADVRGEQIANELGLKRQAEVAERVAAEQPRLEELRASIAGEDADKRYEAATAEGQQVPGRGFNESQIADIQSRMAEFGQTEETPIGPLTAQFGKPKVVPMSVGGGKGLIYSKKKPVTSQPASNQAKV